MSITAAIWLIIALTLLVMSGRRPVYACCAYLMTFFAAPQFWWWGKGLLVSITLRWNLVFAIALVVIVLMHWGRRAVLSARDKQFFTLLFLFVINAVIVHHLAADNPLYSYRYLDVVWKSAILAVIIRLAVKTREDIQIFLFAVVILCGYVGYEVVVNGAGTFEHGRLEGIGIPNASDANGVAAVISMGLVLAGYFAISSRSLLMKLASIAVAPLILDTILRCNSRGAFLGLIASGIWFIAFSKGQVRKRSIGLLFFGLCAVMYQAADPKIWERFSSIFVDSKERDNSATERLLYWEAAVKMIADYPMGSGGKSAFASARGSRYIEHFRPNEFRSVHNGFFDVAASWGIQGITLLMLAFACAFIPMFHASRRLAVSGDYDLSFLGVALQATLVGQMICTVFTSVLDGEWYLWLAVCSLSYTSLAFAAEGGHLDTIGSAEDDMQDDIDPLPDLGELGSLGHSY